jgi:Protein of unknown function (DUF5818)
MKVKLAMAFLAVFVFAGTAGLASAQDNKMKTTHKKTRTLTGCVSKGEDANEYRLTTAKGSTWELNSDAVKLADHVGHSVTVTGTVAHNKMHGMKEDAKGEAKEHGMAKHSTEHGQLTVTDLTMVSESCTK